MQISIIVIITPLNPTLSESDNNSSRPITHRIEQEAEVETLIYMIVVIIKIIRNTE